MIPGRVETSATEVALGIQVIALPTPFRVGPVNVYLLEGDPPALVDSGPGLATNMLALERAIGAIGYDAEDIGLHLITHQHPDHLGLTQPLAERSGGDVAALDRAVDFLARYPDRVRADDEYVAGLMRIHGFDPDIVHALLTLAQVSAAYGTSARVTRPVADGETVSVGGRRFDVLHRPGHSPSDILLHDAQERVLIAGDHLLPAISSNALLTLPLDATTPGRRPRPLLQYRESLRRTRDLDVDLVLPGHGRPFSDHRELIDQRLADQDARADDLLGMLRSGGCTANELAFEVWGRSALDQAPLTLSEVLGHLDLLIEAGLVIEHDAPEVVRFEAI